MTVERWAEEYVLAESLEHELAPPPRPARFSGAGVRIARPGRPPELVALERPPKTPGRGARIEAGLPDAFCDALEAYEP